jgi:predicted HD superfamily hydrolase involved in NAD metabolism
MRGNSLETAENRLNREKMIDRLQKDLTRDRFAHTMGVQKTAIEMARTFGADEEKAGLAGLLHDCAKCMTLEQMLIMAKNEPTDAMLKQSKALMHAVAGRAMAESVYGVRDKEVLDAIRWHTTGRAGMSRLEKIIYLADMIEPTRKPYPGLEELRGLCHEDLEKAMHTALLQSMHHVLEQGKDLHPDTMAALEEYEDSRKSSGT